MNFPSLGALLLHFGSAWSAYSSIKYLESGKFQKLWFYLADNFSSFAHFGIPEPANPSMQCCKSAMVIPVTVPGNVCAGNRVPGAAILIDA